MDEAKDAQRRDQLSRFLDNKVLRVQVFGPNISAERAYRRAERLVAAIHLVTNHISAQEPARVLCRRRSLDLLSSILALREQMRNPESSPLRKAQVLIRELISLTRVLSVSGYLSVQNAETLVEAFDELANFLVASQRSAFSEGIPLGKDELLDTGDVPMPRERLSDIQLARSRKTPLKDRGKGGGGVSNKDEKLRTRTNRIVGVLTTQGQLGIKDIAASLPEFSEKMIQRELKGLVTQGRIKKAGSKRWSTYVLA